MHKQKYGQKVKLSWFSEYPPETFTKHNDFSVKCIPCTAKGRLKVLQIKERGKAVLRDHAQTEAHKSAVASLQKNTGTQLDLLGLSAKQKEVSY